MLRIWRLCSPSTWKALRRATPALFGAVRHFERREYELALRSFEIVLEHLPKPDPSYFAFHAYLLLLTGSAATAQAWEHVVQTAEGDDGKTARHAAAVAKYYLASFDGSPDAFQQWRQAAELRPSRGLAAYIQLPEMALAT